MHVRRGRLAAWSYDNLGVADKNTMFADETVDAWLRSGEHPYSSNSLRSVRSRVRKVERAAFGRPSRSTLSARSPTTPYSAEQERWFREAAALTGYRNASARMWVAAAPLGAGLDGRDTAAATVWDLVERGEGRLAVIVRGDHPRTVPLRREYTQLARDARDAADGDLFFSDGAPNNAYNTAARVSGGLSFPRARVTWLLAHIAHGTHSAALLRFAGPVSEATLRRLAKTVAQTMTSEEAVELGMGP